MKRLLFIIITTALFSCSKEEIKIEKQNKFINKAFVYKGVLVDYTLEFTTDSECVHTSPNLFGGGESVYFMEYSYHDNVAIITNTYDDCGTHNVVLEGSQLVLAHDNGFVNRYDRLK